MAVASLNVCEGCESGCLERRGCGIKTLGNKMEWGTETGWQQRDEGWLLVNRDWGRSGRVDCSCVGDPYLMREREKWWWWSFHWVEGRRWLTRGSRMMHYVTVWLDTYCSSRMEWNKNNRQGRCCGEMPRLALHSYQMRWSRGGQRSRYCSVALPLFSRALAGLAQPMTGAFV